MPQLTDAKSVYLNELYLYNSKLAIDTHLNICTTFFYPYSLQNVWRNIAKQSNKLSHHPKWFQTDILLNQTYLTTSQVIQQKTY